MTKKNRVSFSSLSIEEKKVNENKNNTHHSAHRDTSGAPKRNPPSPERRKHPKSSSYQYTKKRFSGGGRSQTRPVQNRNENAIKIPNPEKGVIRIIPLGGVEEIGKNMTAIEIGDDIIVIDAGMHFSNEETPGVDYVIPNTTYLEERKDKIRALFVTHGHLDHIGGVPLVLSRIGNPPVYSRNEGKHCRERQCSKSRWHENSFLWSHSYYTGLYGSYHRNP